MTGRIPAGTKDGKKVMAVIKDHGDTWPKIAAHAAEHGPFESPDQLRRVFPTAKVTIQPMRV